MKILFVHASAEWSIADVGSGYRAALARAGHEVIDWRLNNRLRFVSTALSAVNKADLPEITRIASEMIVIEAVKHQPDWVVIVCAMAFHPDALVLLRRAGFKTVVIFTESPYMDADQAEFAELCDVVATNDRFSAEKYGWLHLPAAYDPERHHLVEPTERHDIVIVGTGWDQRVERLAAIDWTGIDLAIYGFWPQLDDTLPSDQFPTSDEMHPNPEALAKIGRFYQKRGTDNDETVALYSGAKICINDHRPHPHAYSANPRVYEVLAVGGGLLLTDWRDELADILGSPAMVNYGFRDAAELEYKIRLYLDHEGLRRAAVENGRVLLETSGCFPGGQTFDARVAVLTEALERATDRTPLRMVPA